MRPIQTRFRLGCRFYSLTLPRSRSRWVILQQARDQVLLPSHCLSANGFMFYFTPLPRFLFTVPTQYYFAIGYLGVFSLTRWSSLIHTGFHVPHATREVELFYYSPTGLSPSMVQDSADSASFFFLTFDISNVS